MKEIKSIKVREGMKVKELVEGMRNMGFGARKIGEAVEIIKEMKNDKDCKIFLGIAGAMTPSGMSNIILDLLDFTDVLVITGANLTHDLINNIGGRHLQGSEDISDIELNKNGLDRIYDVFMENSVYCKLEDFFDRNFEKLKDAKNIKQFLSKLGEVSPKGSILSKCYEKGIPVFCPAIADSGIGLMMWGQLVKGKKINVDAFDDLKEIIEISWKAKKKGVIYVGGGFCKNYIQQALQFSKGADYGVQVTMDRVEGGGSSGAELKEGISWGKLNKNARFVDLRMDATIVLPLIIAALKEKN